MAKNNSGILIALAVGIGGYFLIKNMDGGSGGGTDKKGALMNWAQGTGSSNTEVANFISALTYMTTSEINATYDYIFNYIKKGTRPPAGSPLYNSITAISEKYNIFT